MEEIRLHLFLLNIRTYSNNLEPSRIHHKKLPISHSCLVLVAGSDDLVEGWLEGGTTNEESVDILFGNKICCVGIGN